MNADHGDMIRAEIKSILGKLVKYSVAIADTFQEDKLLDVMIAPSDGDLYGNIKKQLYSSPGVFQRISNWESIVRGPKL